MSEYVVGTRKTYCSIKDIPYEKPTAEEKAIIERYRKSESFQEFLRLDAKASVVDNSLLPA